MSEYIPPLLFDWTDEGVMRPRYSRLADKYYVVGESYRMVPHEDRSMRSHRYFFASLNEAWKNLPEDLAERYPSPEHLRRYALIKAGFHDQRSLVASSKAEALRLMAYIRPIDEFAIVTVSESVVTTYTAKSQSMRAMDKKAFRASADAVLDVVSAMIGTSRDALVQNAEQAA